MKEVEVKRSKAGLALIIIGVILIGLAPIWKWVIGPMFVQIPDDIETTSIYEGTLTLYANPETLTLLPPEQAQKIPIAITRIDTSQPDLSTGDVAVIKETIDAVGPGGEKVLSTERFFAVDRKSAENVAGNNSDIDREGFFLFFGFNVAKDTYPVWDDDTRTTGDAEFVKVSTRDGKENKGVTVYEFEAVGKDKMFEPPLGLPAEITGAQVKSLLSNPNLALSDTQKLKIDYLKETEATIVVDQRTGSVVDLPAYKETFYADASDLGLGELKLAELQYKQTADNVSDLIDEVSQYYGMLDLVEIWIPVILLVVGLIILVLGVALFARKPSE